MSRVLCQQALGALLLFLLPGRAMADPSGEPTYPAEPNYYVERGPTTRPENQFTLYVGVPMATPNTAGALRPGGMVETRYGAKLGVFSPELAGGWQGQHVDESLTGGNSVRLTSWWMRLGFRLHVETRTIATPFASVAFDLDFWRAKGAQAAPGCDAFYCQPGTRFAFTPGFSGKLGLALRPRRLAHLAFETGVRWSMAFPGQVFAGNRHWLAPFLGFTIYD